MLMCPKYITWATSRQKFHAKNLRKAVNIVRAVIDRCADGFFDYDCGKLLFSTARIEAEMPQGQLFEGDFVLSSEDGRDFTATIYTSSMRLVCRNDHVDNEAVATIHYVFDSTGLEPGDVVKGDIQVVSNAGEYYLPFVFSISYCRKTFAIFF